MYCIVFRYFLTRACASYRGDTCHPPWLLHDTWQQPSAEVAEAGKFQPLCGLPPARLPRATVTVGPTICPFFYPDRIRSLVVFVTERNRNGKGKTDKGVVDRAR